VDKHSAPTFSERNKRIAKIIARAWADDGLANRLQAQPEAVFAEFGVDVPKGKTLKVVVNSPSTVHFILPERPAGLADAEIDTMSVDRLVDLLDQTEFCESKCFG
jgi:hypothetical protein